MDDPQTELSKEQRAKVETFRAELKKKRSPAPVQLQLVSLNHKSDKVTQHIEKSLISPRKEYTVSKTTNQLMHTHQFDNKKGPGEIKLIISGTQAGEPIENALDSLGDACRDTFVAITGLCIQKHGMDLRRGITMSIDEILDACGKKRSNGSFTPEARAEVIKHLKTLSQTYFEFYMPSTRQVKRGRKLVTEDHPIRIKGPLLTHDGSIGQYSSITGKELWEVQSIIPGPWAYCLGDNMKLLPIQTKLLPKQVLTYNPSTEPYHKRLGHYISGLFRINARKTKGVMPSGITMRALFEGALIEPSRNRGEFKDDIDNALKHLKIDGVIGNYWYMDEKTLPEVLEKIDARQGRWFKDYLRLYINFSPTQATLDHYKNIAKKEPIEGDENED